MPDVSKRFCLLHKDFITIPWEKSTSANLSLSYDFKVGMNKFQTPRKEVTSKDLILLYHIASDNFV